jgi:hypothetical protein
MRKVILFASNIICLAEHSLRGLKAWARRVMAEWLKTPRLVSSKDQSFIDIGLFLENCGCVPTNPTKDAYFYKVNLQSVINNSVDKTDNTNTTIRKI